MEETYLDRVIGGDVEAFRYFITTYKDMAFNVSIAILKDEQDAEEVIQDAFVKAFIGLKTFKRTSKFKSWFYRIVVNESFLKIRRDKRNLNLVSLEEIEVLPLIENNEKKSTEEEKIKHALKLLSANESLALNLFYIEEYSIKEISKICEWSSSNTKVILHRARKNIKIILEKTNKIKHE